MSRYSDAIALPRTGHPPALPPVSWTRIEQSAPIDVPVEYKGPTAALPNADAVVLTWATEEWSALDHVFLDSATTRAPEEQEFQRGWHPYLYSHDIGQFTTDGYGPLWGYYRLVDIPAATGGQARRVLLFKCSAHLAHPPWLDGLRQMLTQILKDAGPQAIYSIGTAGGSCEEFRLGDVVITASAHLLLKEPENTPSGLSGQTFSCKKAPPSAGKLLDEVQQLYFALDTAATYPVLERILRELQAHHRGLQALTLEDLVNEPLRPENLGAPATRTPGTPLLSTDYYYIAPDEETAWAALEMDDAIVAAAAQSEKVPYLFVRNISDTLVPGTTRAGEQIDQEARELWSGRLYDEFGLYSSCNGALATWALLAS